MGMWWKDINEIPKKSGRVYFEGNPKVYSKNIPILWRWTQPWVVLKVCELDSLKGVCLRDSPKTTENPYCIYFETADQTMKYRRILNSQFIAVRVGSLPISFQVLPFDTKDSLEHIMFLTQWSDLFYKQSNYKIFYPLEINKESQYDRLFSHEIKWI